MFGPKERTYMQQEGKWNRKDPREYYFHKYPTSEKFLAINIKRRRSCVFIMCYYNDKK